MQPRNVSRLNPTNQRKNSTSLKKGKGKMQNCTLKFFCLDKVDAEKPPTAIYEKTALSNIGLGPGSITLDINSTDVHHNLIEKFPLLEAGGGYELLLYQRGGLEQGFHRITPPYTAARIKEIAGQAQVYVRPLQQDLDKLEEMGLHSTVVKVRKSF